MDYPLKTAWFNKYYNDSIFNSTHGSNNPNSNNTERQEPQHYENPKKPVHSSGMKVVMVSIFFGVCLGLLIGLVISLPLIFVFKDSDNESTNKNNVQQNMTPMLMISGTALKDDWIWTEQLENTTSEEFRDMSDRFCSLVDLSFSMSSLKDFYDSCRVTNMSEGSVIFQFDILMITLEEDNTTNSVGVVNEIISPRFEMLSLSEMRVVIGMDNCENIRCENNGSCVDALNSYFCKCTENYYGDFCQHPISDTNNNCATLPQSEPTSPPCDECVCPSSPVPDSVTFSLVSCETVTCPQCQDCNEVTTCPPSEAVTCPITTTEQSQPCPPCNVTCPELTTCGPCDECSTVAPPINYCEMNSCENGGTCVEDQIAQRSYCLCAEGWTGANCTVALTCHMEPCGENGTCIEKIEQQTYECICPDKFGSPDCSTPILSPCDRGPCAENSTCYETPDGTDYFCDCQAGFTSRNCSIPIPPPCDEPTLCKNGSTCVNLENGTHLCLCEHGFSGIDCSDVIEKPCDNNPCEGSGSRCINNLSGGFVCECGPGLTGTNCSLSSSTCQDSPCNSGTCLDLKNGTYHCLCPDGVEGENCSISTPSVCAVDGATDLCGNGSCVEADFRCMCDPGYEGLNCSSEVSTPCTPDPCENGGICYSLEDGDYYCACTQNFTGTNCMESLDRCANEPCQNNGSCYNILGGEGYVCKCGSIGEGQNCTKTVTCDTDYTKVRNLGCFHKSDMAINPEDAVDYCMQREGTIPENNAYSLNVLQDILTALGAGESDDFMLAPVDDNTFSCWYYDGIAVVYDFGGCHSDFISYHVLCKMNN